MSQVDEKISIILNKFKRKVKKKIELLVLKYYYSLAFVGSFVLLVIALIMAIWCISIFGKTAIIKRQLKYTIRSCFL